MKLIYDNMEKLIALCQKYKVKSMYVFGSILTKNFNDESDVDLSVDMLPDPNPLVAGSNFLNLYLDLQDLFARKIDLVDEASIRNPYFRKELNDTKQLIYG